MSDESSWIYDIIPEAQAKAMNEKGEKIKDFVETKKKLFGLGISINVGNHMIVGRLD